MAGEERTGTSRQESLITLSVRNERLPAHVVDDPVYGLGDVPSRGVMVNALRHIPPLSHAIAW
jgi:hypothetical protein